MVSVVVIDVTRDKGKQQNSPDVFLINVAKGEADPERLTSEDSDN
jgi:hypothetical protein